MDEVSVVTEPSIMYRNAHQRISITVNTSHTYTHSVCMCVVNVPEWGGDTSYNIHSFQGLLDGGRGRVCRTCVYPL